MLDKDDVFSHCLKRWNADDKKTSYFKQNCDEWFSQLPGEIQDVSLQLLEMFTYYSQKCVNQYLLDLGAKLEDVGNPDPEVTLYAPLLSNKGIVNSSVDYLCTYRQLHEISKFKTTWNLDAYIAASPGKYSQIKNIVIVDDYCGSGKSLESFVELHSDHLKGKHIYYVVTYFMVEARPLINKISETHEVEIDVIYVNIGHRVFDSSRFSGKEDELRKAIKKASKKLNIDKRYSLGKYNSESLVSFYNDTPNNTIGLFWYDSDKFFSIFPREFENTDGLKRPTPQSLKQQKDARIVQNYTAATRRAKNE